MKDSLRNIRWISLGLPIVPALVIGGGLVLEASHIALASPEALVEYHFGSEAMVGAGGWSYSSRWAYVASNAVWGVPLLVLAGVLIWVLARRSRSLAWLTAGSLAFLLALGAAALAVSAAWDHNPQEEFHTASSVNWGALSVIAASWFACVYAVIFAVARLAASIAGSKHAA